MLGAGAATQHMLESEQHYGFAQVVVTGDGCIAYVVCGRGLGRANLLWWSRFVTSSIVGLSKVALEGWNGNFQFFVTFILCIIGFF